ncbi:MAG: exonuclease subunit SbcD [Caldiserica bacterium]|nr:exonuclease subunit SbcD [Caldisericota bacterium]
MRLLHTADWHVGSTLAGLDRFDETGKLLDELFAAAQSEKVDAVLVAGDVFDNPMPGNVSQKLVFDFFARLSGAGIRAVVLAGNHDGQVFVPSKSLLSLGTASVFEKPSSEQYQVAFRSRADEPVVVTALPYPHERVVMKLNGAGDDVHGDYAGSVSTFIRWLAGHMDTTDINIFAAHLMIGGAQLTDTERPMSVSPFFAIPAQSLPSQTMYNALGHVHRHQQLVNAPARSEYSGSIFRVNFSEEGTPKGFNLVDADTKGNLTVQFCDLKSAIPLHNVECTTQDWPSRLEPFRDSGYTKARIHADDPPFNLQGEIRAACPWVVKVEFLRSKAAATTRPTIAALASTNLETVQSMYRAYGGEGAQKDSGEATDDVMKVVGELYREVTHADTDA